MKPGWSTGRRLAFQLFQSLGAPERFKRDAKGWSAVFKELTREKGVDALWDALRLVDESAYWIDRLAEKVDPMAHFARTVRKDRPGSLLGQAASAAAMRSPAFLFGPRNRSGAQGSGPSAPLNRSGGPACGLLNDRKVPPVPWEGVRFSLPTR